MVESGGKWTNKRVVSTRWRAFFVLAYYKRHTAHRGTPSTAGTNTNGVFFFGYFAATQLALQLRQERSQVACSNKEARKRLTESNGTPAMDRW